MTLDKLYEQYRDENRKLRSPKTDAIYRVALRQLTAALGRTPTTEDLSDASIRSLERFLASRSPYTINERTGRIKAIWRWCAKKGIVNHWPTLDRLPTHEPYRRAWTVEQVRTLLAATTSLTGTYGGVSRSLWWNAYLRCLWDTGERSGAARAFKWDWLTSDGIHVPSTARKGHKSAYYRLTPSTRESIERIRAPERPDIFPWLLSDSSFFLHYGHLLRAAGLPSDSKSKGQRMRRTHLTYWAIAGKDASARAQHTSRALTEKFYLDETMLPHQDPGDVLPPL